MITILASPKPFVGAIKRIQQDAISSWKRLHPEVEIILYGSGLGIAECAHEMGVAHVPHVDTTSLGTPYLSAITSHAARHGRHDTQAFINCDIILVDDVVNAIGSIPFSRYLLSNGRVNLPEHAVIDVAAPGWKDRLFVLARSNQLRLSYGSDLFVFKRGFFDEAPRLVIGRGGIDNAICAHALRLGVPLIDATRSILCLHQFHGYDHVSGGRRQVFEGIEKEMNAATYGGWPLHVRDGDWDLVDNELVRTYGRGDRLRAAVIRATYRSHWHRLSPVLIPLYKFVRGRIPAPMYCPTVEEALAHLGYRELGIS